MHAYVDQYEKSTEMPVLAIVLIVAVYVTVIALMLVAYAKIISRTGYPWPWLFIMFVPVVNIVMLLLLAFKEWPVQRELELTRRALEVATGYPFPPGSQLTHYGNYQIGSGLQGYGAGMGYADPSGQPYPGQPYSGQPYSGHPYSGQLYADGGQEFGQDDRHTQAPSDNPYQPKP